MHPLFWFLCGCAATAVVTLACRRPRRRVHPRPARPTPLRGLPEPIRPRPRRIELSESRSLRELSESLGDELASLATGVEGQSQLLCECLGEPQRAMEHAEELWETVRRLRFFSEKLQSSSAVPPLGMKPTDIGQLLAGLVLEIEDYSPITLQVSLNIAPSLPLARANADSLRSAIFFLIECVFALEPNASTLLIQAYAQASPPPDPAEPADTGETAEVGAEAAPRRSPSADPEGEDSLGVHIGIEASLKDGDEIRVKSPPQILFSYNAARNLLQAQGAYVALNHSPGLNAMASVTLAAAPDDALRDDPVEPPTEAPHRFGGVLVMEGNPTIRHMLARELRESERNVIVCADGIAAATLFEATPERFELLILEQEGRRLPGETLARKALEQNPDLKVVLVTPAPGSPISPELRALPQLRVLHKPFGLMEFRDVMAMALGPEPTPPRGLRPTPVEAV